MKLSNVLRLRTRFDGVVVVQVMVEQGTDLRYIKELLGHSSSKTTEIYTHVSKRAIDKIRNPVDDFFE